VEFVHVRGHSGVILNERADELARQAISDRRTVEKVYGPTGPAASPRA
jgi:ribonuclease HI